MSKTRVMIIGLGYVGSEILEHLIKSTNYDVIGFDTNADVINNKRNEFKNFDITRYVFEHDSRKLTQAEIFVICTPTPLKAGKLDLSFIEKAGESISKILKVGDLVILESTSFPGTTETVLAPILEQSHLIAGKDFYLGFASERMDVGNLNYNLTNTVKVVAGINSKSCEKISSFYLQFVETVHSTPGVREAELSKLIENTYRQVNLALVNELAKFCHRTGINLWEALRAAETKPFGYQVFYPGPGVGGHCIPVDPIYLNEYFKEQLGFGLDLISCAQTINDSMPKFVVDRIVEYLNLINSDSCDRKVLLIGAGYKANVPDTRNSPIFEICNRLNEVGIIFDIVDNQISMIRIEEKDIEISSQLPAELSEYDLAIILQHNEGLDYDKLLSGGVKVFDTRGKIENTLHL